MHHISIVPAVRVASIEAALPPWTALGFELAFAFADARPLPEESLDGATFARLDAPSRTPVSVFLDTRSGAPGTTVHLMLAHPREVDETAERLTRSGQAIARPAADQPWGMRDLHVKDQSGNVVVVGAALEP